MWVADNTDHKLYAYRLDGGARQESREFNLDSGNNESRGIWSDGNTIWVIDRTDQKLYAYNLQNGERTGRPGLQHTQRGREQQTLTTSHRAATSCGSRTASKTRSTPTTCRWCPRPTSSPPSGDRRIAITWDNPQRSAITGYQYRVSSDGRRLLEPGLDHHAGQQRPHNRLHRQEPGQQLRARHRGARPGGHQTVRGGQVRRHPHGPARRAPDAGKTRTRWQGTKTST